MKIRRRKDIEDIWFSQRDSLAVYINSIVGGTEANSLAHDVLMKLYSSCCSGREIHNVRSWLFRIAHNVCMDYFKSRKREVELRADFSQEDVDLIYKEAGEVIEPLLRLLPAKYGIPLRMSDLQGYKQQEVADKLNLTLAATKSRILRGRGMLKNKFFECFHLDFLESGGLHSYRAKKTCKCLS